MTEAVCWFAIVFVFIVNWLYHHVGNMQHEEAECEQRWNVSM